MSEPVNDYSQQRVPDSQTVSSGHVALVIIGGTIAIPAFLLAAQLGNSLGFISAIIAFVCGSFILGIMNTCTSWVGSSMRLSSSKLIELAFGRKGAMYVNGLIAFTLAGWYGVICKMFGDTANTTLNSLGIDLPVEIYTVLGSILMLWVTLKGFKGIDKLALWLVPLMFFFILYAANSALGSANVDALWEVKNDLPFTSAISAVVGTYIVGVVIQPDYSRFASNAKSAAVAAGFALMIVFPAVLILTSIPAIISQQSDLILIMVGIGIGVPAFLLLLLSSWSSNVLSLYSSSLSVTTIAPQFSLRNVTIFIATVGTVIAFVDVQKYFIDFLVLLGITIPPVGAIYCLDFWLTKKGNNTKLIITDNHWSAIFAWFTGCLLGFLSYQNIFTVTQVPSLDSILISSLFYLFFRQNSFLRLWSKEKV